METPNPPTQELCAADYTATLTPVPDGKWTVVLLAQGFHSTSGYEVFFHKAQIDVYPPEFSLWHTKSSGVELDLVTPFAKFASFDFMGDPTNVRVVDANGEHSVPILKIKSSLVHK